MNSLQAWLRWLKEQFASPCILWKEVPSLSEAKLHNAVNLNPCGVAKKSIVFQGIEQVCVGADGSAYSFYSAQVGVHRCNYCRRCLSHVSGLKQTTKNIVSTAKQLALQSRRSWPRHLEASGRETLTVAKASGAHPEPDAPL